MHGKIYFVSFGKAFFLFEPNFELKVNLFAQTKSKLSLHIQYIGVIKEQKNSNDFTVIILLATIAIQASHFSYYIKLQMTKRH